MYVHVTRLTTKIHEETLKTVKTIKKSRKTSN